MSKPINEILPIIGTSMGDGFYAGRIRLDDGQVFALIVAPKADGQHADTLWIDEYKDAPGAQSYNDGLANTIAMADAGSALAQWARSLRIGDHDDWYIPSQDELEVIYRNLKPTAEKNDCYARSGINLSAVPPTRPYTTTLPAQTTAKPFTENGNEAFDAAGYWSSTQHAANSDYAWYQYFDCGDQHYSYTTTELRARAVRRFAI